jgi:hypothetical protein
MQVQVGLFTCSYTCAINFDSFVRGRSLNLPLNYSSETTSLSAERPSGAKAAKQYSSRTQARLLAAEHKMHAMLLLCTWQQHTKSVICYWGVCQSVETVWSVQILRCRIQTRPISWRQVGERRRWNSLVKLCSWATLGLSDPWTRSRHSRGPITKTNNSAVSNAQTLLGTSGNNCSKRPWRHHYDCHSTLT